MIAEEKREPTILGGVLKIGALVRFVPCANLGCSAGLPAIFGKKVTGTVVFIHKAHRWYSVEYVLGKPDCIGYECFKF